MLPNNSPLKTLSGLRIEGVMTGEGGEPSEVLQRYLINPFDELKPLAVDHYAIGVLDIDVLEGRDDIVDCFTFKNLDAGRLLLIHAILGFSKAQLVLPQGDHKYERSFGLDVEHMCQAEHLLLRVFQLE